MGYSSFWCLPVNLSADLTNYGSILYAAANNVLRIAFFFQMLAGVLLILHFPHTHARTVWHDHHTHPLHGIITHNSFDVTNNNQRTAEVIFQWCILRVYRDPNGTTPSHEQLSEMEMELRFTRSNNNPRWSRHAKLHVNYMLIRSHFLLNLSFCKRRKTKIREEKFGKKLSTSKLTACAKHSCIFHIRFANHSLWIMNFVDENCDGKKVFVWILFAVNVWALWIVIKYSEVYFSVVLQQRHVRVDACLRRWNDDSVDENIYIKMYLYFLGESAEIARKWHGIWLICAQMLIRWQCACCSRMWPPW